MAKAARLLPPFTLCILQASGCRSSQPSTHVFASAQPSSHSPRLHTHCPEEVVMERSATEDLPQPYPFTSPLPTAYTIPRLQSPKAMRAHFTLRQTMDHRDLSLRLRVSAASVTSESRSGSFGSSEIARHDSVPTAERPNQNWAYWHVSPISETYSMLVLCENMAGFD